jgi:hypothetical protein
MTLVRLRPDPGSLIVMLTPVAGVRIARQMLHDADILTRPAPRAARIDA